MLILASASPRRKELLARLNIPFEVVVSGADEDCCALLLPEEYVRSVSARKAAAVASTHPNDLVLGADTAVVIDGRILGKPKNEEDARQMLRLLSGRRHEVFTAFTIIGKGKTYSECICTDVHFSDLSEEEISSYIASGEPMDKAGAYGIQRAGGKFVSGISGDYFAVVGLPIHAVYRALKEEFGVIFK